MSGIIGAGAITKSGVLGTFPEGHIIQYVPGSVGSGTSATTSDTFQVSDVTTTITFTAGNYIYANGVINIYRWGGADDIGSTMMEENVVSAAGTTKVLCTEEELQYAITKAGFKPKRRDSEYNLLETPKLVIEAHQYISPPMIQYNVL